MTPENRTALILGATGGAGYETLIALARRGWTVRALARKPDVAARSLPDAPCDWVQGDAMDRDSVIAAARGASLIFHGVNPPGYRQWDKLVLPMIDNTIAAAASARARVLMPGTVYNYGADAFPLLTPDSPQSPATHKGELRVEMEARLAFAADEGRIRATILRCGDWFGPHMTSNAWFGNALASRGKPVRRVSNPSTPGIGHAWAYLPDVGETFARLAEKSDPSKPFERYHFDGYWDADGTGLAQSVARVGGQPDVKIGAVPWGLFSLLAPFSETLRETLKMREFWTHPARLDDTSLQARLGGVRYTPIDEAVRATLVAMGCLGGAPATMNAALA